MVVKIEKYEGILKSLSKSGKKWWEFDRNEVNPEIFESYCDSKANKREVLDISGSFWTNSIPAMVEAMKAEGVADFTISDGRCNIAEILAVFEDNGAKLQGLTRINSGNNFSTGEPEMKPAFLMKIV